MNKFRKIFSSSLLSISNLVPLISLSNCGTFIVDEEIKAHDEQSWIHAVEYIASCKHPTIFINQNAGYCIQQIVDLYISSTQYALQSNHVYTNPDYKLNDLILLTDGDIWNYKENKPGEKTGYFSYNYGSLIDSKYGVSDILAKSKQKSEKIDLTLGNNMMITNAQDFDLLLEKYDKTRSNYEPFTTSKLDVVATSVLKIFELYDAVDPNIKFNFVLADNLKDVMFRKKADGWKILEEDNILTTLLLQMFRRVDKFYFVSDGAYSFYVKESGGPKVFHNYFCWNGYTSASEQAQILKNIQTLPIDKAKEYFKYVNPILFYNNEKYMYHFSPSKNVTLSPIILNEKKKLTKETMYKCSQPLFIPSSYKNILTDTKYFNNFESSWLEFYHSLDSEGKPKHFSEYITNETKSHWSSTKKNLIFILPGAFRYSSNPPEVLWSDCQKITAKIKENYPTSEWNYIYKLHPGTIPEDADHILKKLLGLQDTDPIPDYCVVLDKTYPFEYLVAMDQQLVASGIETNYHLIDPNTLTDEKPNGILTGFDIFSSCFFSTISLLASEFNIPWEQAKNVIQYDATFIPKKFHFYTYKVEKQDYAKENYDFLQNFYKLPISVGEFKDTSKFKFID